MIILHDSLAQFHPEDFIGFFQGWPRQPSPEQHFQILQSSYALTIAYDSKKHKVAGFVNAISDGIFYAFIPLLEVRPEYRMQQVGSLMLTHLRKRLSTFYAVDAIADHEVSGFYLKAGFSPCDGFVTRNHGCSLFSNTKGGSESAD